MVSYHHVQYQKKLILQSWENFVTDGQPDESDFERPKIKSIISSHYFTKKLKQ